MTVLIGIAGGTGSGKTSFAVKIRDRVGEDRCVPDRAGRLLQATAARSATPRRPRSTTTTPTPSTPRCWCRTCATCSAGRPVPHLTYDHASYARRVLPDPVKPRQVVILEGILVLAEEPLRRLMDIKLFIDADSDVRILRRLQRDIQERGRNFESVQTPVPGLGAADAPRVRRAVEALRRPDRPRGRRERGRARGRGRARPCDAGAMSEEPLLPG